MNLSELPRKLLCWPKPQQSEVPLHPGTKILIDKIRNLHIDPINQEKWCILVSCNDIKILTVSFPHSSSHIQFETQTHTHEWSYQGIEHELPQILQQFLPDSKNGIAIKQAPLRSASHT
jgi:hypothetical protein